MWDLTQDSTPTEDDVAATDAEPEFDVGPRKVSTDVATGTETVA